MDDAFIKKSQITQGREEQRSSLPWVCFSFLCCFFLPRNFFSERRIFHRRKKSSVGQALGIREGFVMLPEVEDLTGFLFTGEG